jgi:hypothetical protein
MTERGRRIFTVGPDDEPIWLRTYVQRIDERRAATLVAE